MNPIFHLLFQTTRLISNELNGALKEHGLYSSQWTVLFCIHSRGAMPMADMCRYLNVEAPTITRTVGRLEELGWVTVFQGKDRREKIVHLSEKAKEQFPQIEQSIIQFESRFLAQLTEIEKQEVMDLLEKLGKVVNDD